MRTRDENKEAAIREKALEIIVKDGFDGLSMQKLAQAAGVSPATIYIYYHNREDLLNSLYNAVNKKFTDEALKKFEPQMNLSEGLWLQWKNRLRFILDYPNYFIFFEQFRNSPLINHKDIESDAFKDSMCQFVRNAAKRGEIERMEPELFWSLAYGPFYALVKFHLFNKSPMRDSYKLTEQKLKILHGMVIKALTASAR